jgi:hypothetical protein
MTSLKIGSSHSPQHATLRPTVERPVTAQRAETVSPRPLATRDEFVPGSNRPSATASTGDTFAPQSAKEPSEFQLPKALEPFREALDKIASQLTPELLRNPLQLIPFVLNAVKELGLAAKDLIDAAQYVIRGPIAQNTGKDRFA